jgi:hypothetical protein
MSLRATDVPYDAWASEVPIMALGGSIGIDPAETVARVAVARRGRLLRLYRRRLRLEDLEDCYSQATLELVSRARREPFVSDDHAANAIELRFKSRIEDRRRAVEGRSGIEAAIARAVSVDAPDHESNELEDRAAAVERKVFARDELLRLRELIADLSREFCRRHAWSIEKYRKVAQRARTKLRGLRVEAESGARCLRLEGDIHAVMLGTATDRAGERARMHLENCPSCAHMAAALARGTRRRTTALIPLPFAAGASALAGCLSRLGRVLRRMAGLTRHPFAQSGAQGSAGVAGGSLASAGVLKIGLAAMCVAGAAGGYAVCARLGVVTTLRLGLPSPHSTLRHHGHVSHTRPQQPVRQVSQATATTAASVTVHGDRITVLYHHHLSAIAQIRREFGAPPAKAATVGTTTSSRGAASMPVEPTASVPTQSAPQVKQTQTEFGFEK